MTMNATDQARATALLDKPLPTHPNLNQAAVAVESAQAFEDPDAVAAAFD